METRMTGACFFHEHARCSGTVEIWDGEPYGGSCECDCHPVMETEHNAEDVMQTERRPCKQYGCNHGAIFGQDYCARHLARY